MIVTLLKFDGGFFKDFLIYFIFFSFFTLPVKIITSRFDRCCYIFNKDVLQCMKKYDIVFFFWKRKYNGETDTDY